MSFQREIDETLRYLASPEAIATIEQDPYWPKWDTPWWRILTLFELGIVNRVPEKTINALVQKIDSHYLKTFPLLEKDIPDSVDPYRHIACHCALGSIYQVLSAYGVDVDARLPWIRPWFLRYQLPDGGLNCDEQAYRGARKSSIVSSLPAWEALLYCSPNGLTEAEGAFVDAGAHYLVKHHLVYKTSSRTPMDQDFLKLCFPRFYSYDFLRGLTYLVTWNRCRENKNSDVDAVIAWGRACIAEKMQSGQAINERVAFDETKTLAYIESTKNWQWRPAVQFALLTAVGSLYAPSKQLTELCNKVAV